MAVLFWLLGIFFDIMRCIVTSVTRHLFSMGYTLLIFSASVQLWLDVLINLINHSHRLAIFFLLKVYLIWLWLSICYINFILILFSFTLTRWNHRSHNEVIAMLIRVILNHTWLHTPLVAAAFDLVVYEAAYLTSLVRCMLTLV